MFLQQNKNNLPFLIRPQEPQFVLGFVMRYYITYKIQRTLTDKLYVLSNKFKKFSNKNAQQGNMVIKFSSIFNKTMV